MARLRVTKMTRVKELGTRGRTAVTMSKVRHLRSVRAWAWLLLLPWPPGPCCCSFERFRDHIYQRDRKSVV